MEMIIDFPGGSRVDAHFGPFTVATDQPPTASAPTPFAVFLSSIGTCAGIYVLGFCRQRGLATEGIKIVQRIHSNPMNGMVEKIDLEITALEGEGDLSFVTMSGDVEVRLPSNVGAVVSANPWLTTSYTYGSHDQLLTITEEIEPMSSLMLPNIEINPN